MAVSLTILATTCPHVPRQECWDVEVSQLKAQQLAFAVKAEDVSGPTFWSVGMMNHLDGRRLEVIANRLLLFGGVQLAVDTTLVFVPRGNGMPRRGANQRAGVALREARARKERTYPEFAREDVKARLVVLTNEMGGRCSSEIQDFLCTLAKAKAQSAPPVLRSKVRSAWLRRWRKILACTAAKAFVASLLHVPPQVRMGTRPQRSKCCAKAATTFEWHAA